MEQLSDFDPLTQVLAVDPIYYNMGMSAMKMIESISSLMKGKAF